MYLDRWRQLLKGMTSFVLRTEGKNRMKRLEYELEDVKKIFQLLQLSSNISIHENHFIGGNASIIKRGEKSEAMIEAKRIREHVHQCIQQQMTILSFALRSQSPVQRESNKMDVESEAKLALSSLRDAFGFNLVLKKSTVGPSINTETEVKDLKGVFVNGDVKAGTVVALFPGVVYLQENYVQLYDSIQEGITTTARLMSRMDGVVINAQEWSVLTTIANGSAGSVGIAPPWTSYRFNTSRIHPLAMAHHIKHPAEGQIPNVLVYNYNAVFESKTCTHNKDTTGSIVELRSNLGQEKPFRRDIPNIVYDFDCIDGENNLLDNEMEYKETLFQRVRREWFGVHDPTVKSKRTLPIFALKEVEESSPPNRRNKILNEKQRSVIPAIVIIAARDIKSDEELLLNYRLNPNAKCPEWYAAVDIEEDRKRWM